MAPRYRSRLHRARVEHNETQESMSRKTGIGLRTYRRLENGEIANPPLRYLVNCALSLDVALIEICEPGWVQWSMFQAHAAKPRRQLRLTQLDS